ncbi:MAG: heliorhodopsin HeR, partial [Tepidiformaceae bacterium]
NLLPFWLGCIAGAMPWVAIGIYLMSPGSEATAPGFVYGIFVSVFVFFNGFALNMWLQYRRIGPWRNYLFGESVYIFLSLTAKSALAWQVFFPTLVDWGLAASRRSLTPAATGMGRRSPARRPRRSRPGSGQGRRREDGLTEPRNMLDPGA